MIDLTDTHWQYCKGDNDISSWPFAEDEADEARLWWEDGTLAASFERDGCCWSLAGSDVCDWFPLSEQLGRWRNLGAAINDLIEALKV